MSQETPWVVVGLGNPGPKYAFNRHNIGFMAAEDWLSQELPVAPAWRTRFQAETASASGRYGRCIVAKPQTFMNRSGDSVSEMLSFFQVKPEQLIVIHDELDFEFGRLAIKKGGGHGGHNGLRSIIDRIGSRDFLRIRLGIGRPLVGEVANWVLSDFRKEEAANLSEVLRECSRAVSEILTSGPAAAMNLINTALPAAPPRKPSP